MVEDINTGAIISDLPAQEDTETTESSIEDEILDLLNSDVAGGLDLRTD